VSKSMTLDDIQRPLGTQLHYTL